ncbi:hypothetical protein MRB53_041931 [Persea americana]|nr:hypothetical protein MRB53_041931 [Persea americana]
MRRPCSVYLRVAFAEDRVGSSWLGGVEDVVKGALCRSRCPYGTFLWLQRCWQLTLRLGPTRLRWGHISDAGYQYSPSSALKSVVFVDPAGIAT